MIPTTLNQQLTELEHNIDKLATAVGVANDLLRANMRPVQLLGEPSVAIEPIVINGVHAGGLVVVNDMWIEFSQLVPIGVRISSVVIGKYRLTGIVPIEHIDDCTYRCKVQTIIEVAE